MQQPPNQEYPQQPPQQQPNYVQPQTYYPLQQQWQQPPFPSQQYQQPQQYQPPMPLSKKKSRKRLWFTLAAVVLVFSVIIGVASQGQNQRSASTIQPTQPTHAMQQPTTVPTAKPTPQSIQYPPGTIADLRGLAAKGDASAIHEFHSESVGLTGVCPQPKREVTVNSSVTGQQLAEDLLAYFMPTNSTTLVGLSYLPIITKVKVVMDTPQVESVSTFLTQVVQRTLTQMQPTSSTHLLSISVMLLQVRSTSSRTETHCPKWENNV